MDREKISEEFIRVLISNMNENPFENLTVKDVASDLRMGENLANDLFKRDDFPSVNIGKTKTITRLAYYLWKMERRN